MKLKYHEAEGTLSRKKCEENEKEIRKLMEGKEEIEEKEGKE